MTRTIVVKIKDTVVAFIDPALAGLFELSFPSILAPAPGRGETSVASKFPLILNFELYANVRFPVFGVKLNRIEYPCGKVGSASGTELHEHDEEFPGMFLQSVAILLTLLSGPAIISTVIDCGCVDEPSVVQETTPGDPTYQVVVG